MHKVNVMVVYSYFIPTGGVEKHILELSKELASHCHKVIIVSLRIDEVLIKTLPPKGLSEPLDEKFIEKPLKGVIIMRINLPRFLVPMKFTKNSKLNILAISKLFGNYICKLINRFDIHIIYACEPIAILATYFALKELKERRNRCNDTPRTVASVHTSWAFKCSLYGKIMSRILTYLDKVIVTNINVCTYERLKSLANNVIFIPNWVDTERFRPRQQIKLRKRRELGIPEDSIVLLYNARFVPVKNPLSTLIAFYVLNKKMPSLNMSLLMIGKGHLRPLIERIVLKLNLVDKVRIMDPLPYNEEYPQIYNLADLFVFTPFHEGVSIVVLEALSSGLPVVYSKMPGIPKDLRKALILADPHNPRDIANKIEKVIKEAAEQPNYIDGKMPYYRKIALKYSAQEILPKLYKEIIKD